MKKVILFFFLLVYSYWLNGQDTRYVDEIFQQVDTIQNLVYGLNYTIVTGAPVLDTLLFDLYSPAVDTCALRPLAVVLPSGTFLPIGFVSPSGDKSDYPNIKICERLAKRGYVAASVQYRLGWNPIAQTQKLRSLTYINALYRSIQDLYSFIRYMHMTVDSLDNPYRIDTTRIAVIGIGTGAFVSLNAAVLEQEEVFIDKFRDSVNDMPFIDTFLIGDLHGVKAATINIANHVGFKDNFQFAFGLDGAVLDSSWIAGENAVPLTAGAVVTHPTIPFGIDPISYQINCNLPATTGAGTGINIVEVSGSACIMKSANELGLNDPLNDNIYNDPVSEAIRHETNNFGLEHLWAINLPSPQTGPWEYWDSTFCNDLFPCHFLPCFPSVCDYLMLLNPDMSTEKANRYIDTSLWFFSPRAFVALKLDEIVCTHCVPDCTTGIHNPPFDRLEVNPNPVEEIIYIQNPGEAVQFSIMNLFGQKVLNQFVDNRDMTEMNVGHLSAGIYLIVAYDRNGNLIGEARVIKK